MSAVLVACIKKQAYYVTKSQQCYSVRIQICFACYPQVMVIVSLEIEPGYIVFPSHKYNV
jgi:hypothetical protein